MKPILSVVIPTYDRIKLLNLCLASLNKQTEDKDSFEVIVVNDGSQENIKDLLDESINFSLRWLDQKHKGPAAAKNLGIDHAKGEFVAFINDDTFPREDFVRFHLDFLRNNAAYASAGKVIWHSESRNGKLERALLHCGIGGWNHDDMHLKECNFRFFCTANIALSKKWLIEEPFDGDFKFAVLEDTELGYRLVKKGLKIFFNKNAVCEHLHHYEPQDLSNRQDKIGKSTLILIKKHPELKDAFLKKYYRITLICCVLLKKFTLLEKIWPELYFIVLGTYHKYKAFQECLVKTGF